jgi:hypothetical protein
VEDFPDDVLLALEDGAEAGTFDCLREIDSGQVTEGGKDVEELGVSQDARPGFDPGTLRDEGNAKSVLVEVLFSLQSVSADRHAMIGETMQRFTTKPVPGSCDEGGCLSE